MAMCWCPRCIDLREHGHQPLPIARLACDCVPEIGQFIGSPFLPPSLVIVSVQHNRVEVVVTHAQDARIWVLASLYTHGNQCPRGFSFLASAAPLFRDDEFHIPRPEPEPTPPAEPGPRRIVI